MPDQLEDDVRASAPQPSEAFVARLEQRVEAGFPSRRRRTPRTAGLWRPALALAACALVALVAVAGVLTSSSGTGDEASSGGASVPATEGSAADGESARAPGVASPAPQTSGAAPVAPGAEPRRVERRTQIDLAARDERFDEVTAGVLRVADATGTIVAASQVSERGGRGYATYDLRVPGSRLDDALAELSRLAQVTSRSASTQDVTAAYVSARDRLQDARDERAALLRALERADSESERDAIRERLRDARRRIAAAEADVRRVRARTDRARVDVTVRSTGEAGAWTPGDALGDAARILEVTAGVLLVAGAVLAPLGLLAAAVVATARLTRRRRREAVLG